MRAHRKKSISRWAEAFQIFERNGLGDYDVSGEHDLVFVHCPVVLFNSEEGKRLQELGWDKDYDAGYDDEENKDTPDEEASWYHHT